MLCTDDHTNESPSSRFTCMADLNHDCTVGVADLLILLANWG